MTGQFLTIKNAERILAEPDGSGGIWIRVRAEGEYAGDNTTVIHVQPKLGTNFKDFQPQALGVTDIEPEDAR